MRPPDLTGKGGAFATAANATNGTKKSNTTGRHTLLFREGATQEGIEYLRKSGFDVFVSNASDPGVVREDEVGAADVIVFSTLGVALIGAEPEQINQLQSDVGTSRSPISKIKEEKVRRMTSYNPAQTAQSTTDQVQIPLSYLEDVYAELLTKFGRPGSLSRQTVRTVVVGFDESKTTWGLQVTKVVDSPFSGRGVKVAVLDTGIELEVDSNGNVQFHPDFRGRSITTASFVPGALTAKDGDGHGTHCIGTACGPREPSTLPGYGVAFESEIFAGKVLNDEGEGADGWILAGIEWAINQGCRVVSMSFGGAKNPGSVFNESYEEVAQRALNAGTLLIAAAGNDSARPDVIQAVNGPADCPSIMAVAAVDSSLKVALFSNGGTNSRGSEVNIAAPGVEVYSSFIKPELHRRLPGTSMATPHVAGIAALFAEANPSATASQLKDLLTDTAQELSFGVRDVGKGLVQAPRNGKPDSQSRGKIVEPKRPVEGTLRKLQTSPITIGGGGSVGLDFDNVRYQQTGSGTFISPQEKLVGCDVVHQSGKLLRNFHTEIDGNQCAVTVGCVDTITSLPSSIRIVGGPSGPLAINFTEDDFRPGAADQPRRFSATHKVISVKVRNLVTDLETGSFTVPPDWKGTIRINN
jgi:subtilisin family serine protease